MIIRAVLLFLLLTIGAYAFAAGGEPVVIGQAYREERCQVYFFQTGPVAFGKNGVRFTSHAQVPAIAMRGKR